MNLNRRIEKLEQTAARPSQMSDRDWREVLNRISKIYGNGSLVEGVTPRPSHAAITRMVSEVYAEV